MNVFSDDDLNRWKNYLKHKDGFKWFPHHSDISAIIARLEAAERFIDKSFIPIECEDHPDYKAWRKAAEK